MPLCQAVHPGFPGKSASRRFHRFPPRGTPQLSAGSKTVESVMVCGLCFAMARSMKSADSRPISSTSRRMVSSSAANASISALAALARTDEATVAERLKAIGVEVKSAEDTVAGLAKVSGHDSFDLLGAALTSSSAAAQPAP